MDGLFYAYEAIDNIPLKVKKQIFISWVMIAQALINGTTLYRKVFQKS